MYGSTGTCTNSDEDTTRVVAGGFSLDHHQSSRLIIGNTSTQHHHHHHLSQSTDQSSNSTTSFHHMPSDSSSVHHYQHINPPTNILPGLLGYEMNQQQAQPNPSATFDHINSTTGSMQNNYSYPSTYDINSSPAASMFQPNIATSNSWSSSSKPQNQLHFSNNATFWNASNTSSSTVLPSLQMQLPSSTTLDEKPKVRTYVIIFITLINFVYTPYIK